MFAWDGCQEPWDAAPENRHAPPLGKEERVGVCLGGGQEHWDAEPENRPLALGQGEGCRSPRATLEQYSSTLAVLQRRPWEGTREPWAPPQEPMLGRPSRRLAGAREGDHRLSHFFWFLFFLICQLCPVGDVGGDPRTLGAGPRTAEPFVGVPYLTCKQQGVLAAAAAVTTAVVEIISYFFVVIYS